MNSIHIYPIVFVVKALLLFFLDKPIYKRSRYALQCLV